jgi:hypothetical protein
MKGNLIPRLSHLTTESLEGGAGNVRLRRERRASGATIVRVTLVYQRDGEGGSSNGELAETCFGYC